MTPILEIEIGVNRITASGKGKAPGPKKILESMMDPRIAPSSACSSGGWGDLPSLNMGFISRITEKLRLSLAASEVAQ
jgi:hypothetical protein